jgi:hypothetical protein
VTDHAKLRELAEKADGEEWTASDGIVWFAAEFAGAANPARVIALLDEIDTLRKSLDEALLDAERYRWLRSDDIEGECEIYVVMEHLPFSDEGDMVLKEEDLDDAIDAALAKKEGA